MIKFFEVSYFINSIFALACIIQVSKIAQTHLYPSNPEIKVYERQLKEIDFPIAFIICAHETSNASSARYTAAGYKDVDNFFTGVRMSGDIGWYGHQLEQSNKTIESVEDTLERLNLDWNEIVENIWVFNTPSYEKSTQCIEDIKWSKHPLHPNCQVLDLMEYNNFNASNPTIKILFTFYPKQNLGISIIPQERNKLLRKRKLNSNMIAYSGPNIFIQDLGKGMQQDVILSLSQFIQAEDNKTNCMNYPNQIFESYRDCDENFLHQRMLNSSKKVMPFWATNNFSEVTIKRYVLQ